jgi:hypothetical protein
MAAWFYRKGDALVPADDAAKRGIAKMGEGECVEVSIVRPRSVQWHRMYFGICGVIGENQDPRRDAESIDYELRIRAGHFDVMLIEDHEVRVPKRIAFKKLSAEKWAELWPSLELAISTRFGNEYLSQVAA